MLNDADILSTLTNSFGEVERQKIIARLYSIPEIWEALRDSEFLAAATEQIRPEEWLPGRLVAHAFGYRELSGLVEEGLAFDGDGENTHAGEAAALLKDVAALSIQLLAKAGSPDGNHDLAESLAANPAMWTPALACAWPDLLASTWLTDTFPAVLAPGYARMLAISLLSNLDLLGAAQSLVALQPEQLANLLPALHEAGFPELYNALGQLSIEKLAGMEQVPDLDPVPGWIAPAMLRAVSGDLEGAHEAFRQAWERANEASARMADNLALIAFQADDPVLELEARRQAVESSATPERRAAFARSLFELDRAPDAQQVIGEPASVPEFIVAGAISAALGDSRRGRELLLHAAQRLEHRQVIADPLLIAPLCSYQQGLGVVQALLRKVDLFAQTGLLVDQVVDLDDRGQPV